MAALTLLLVVAVALGLHAWVSVPYPSVVRVRTWVKRPGNRPLVAAVALALLLRLVWAVATTATTSLPLTDTGRYVTTAVQLASLHFPTNAGEPSAGNAIGYPLLLAPFFWLTLHLSGPSLAFTAALLNVVLGTVNVVLAAILGATWFGRSTRNAAAWLLAVAPAHVYFTSVAMTETFSTTLVLSCVLGGTLLVKTAGEEGPAKGWAIAFGALAGWAALVNPSSMVLLLVPGLALRGLEGSWRRFTVRLGSILLGAALVLVPVAVRNGLQVGVWTPMATSTSFQACMGHWEGADGTATLGDRGIVHCFTRDPDVSFTDWLANPPDEREVYYRNYRAALRYAVSHPGAEARLAVQKLWVTMEHDHEALQAARDFGNRHVAPEPVESVLSGLADAWYALVLALALLGLAAVRRCRRAVPLWAVPVLLLLGINIAHGSPRYHHSAVALLTVLAAHTLVTGAHRLAERRGERRARVAVDETPTPVAPVP